MWFTIIIEHMLYQSAHFVTSQLTVKNLLLSSSIAALSTVLIFA